jgi:hypothetical protein
MLAHKADHLASAQLSPKRSFIVGKLDNDPQARWRVYHSRTGGLVAGDEESRLKTKKEALALARQLEQMDVHGEKFDWDSPGVHDRIDRDEDGFHEALAQARDKAAADLAATEDAEGAGQAERHQPGRHPEDPRRRPERPRGTAPAPDLPPAPDNPRDAGYQDAERAWVVLRRATAPRPRSRPTGGTAQAYNDDIRGLAIPRSGAPPPPSGSASSQATRSPPRRPTAGRMARRRRKEHHVNRYGRIARRYWETYLPSRVAAIPPEQRETFFTEMGDQVASEIATQTPGLVQDQDETDYLSMVGAQGRARKQAEEMVLGESVYLPPEPGTEDLETAADLPPEVTRGG